MSRPNYGLVKKAYETDCANPKEWGRRLDDGLRRAHMLKQTFAKKCGLRRSTIGDYVRGRNPLPRAVWDAARRYGLVPVPSPYVEVGDRLRYMPGTKDERIAVVVDSWWKGHSRHLVLQSGTTQWVQTEAELKHCCVALTEAVEP